MKNIKLLLCLLLATMVTRFALADLVGPYALDANTLFLFHFDEAAGGNVTTNVGLKAGNAYSVNDITAPPGTTPSPTFTNMLGAAGYATNFPTVISFGNCMTNFVTPPGTVSGYLFGYDFNRNGVYNGENDHGVASPDQLAMTNLNIGNGGQTPFTLEALISPTCTNVSQNIICTDSSAANRAFGFAIINTGTLQFQFVSGTPVSQTVASAIPKTGPNAFVTNAWYHVAVTYDGTTAKLYWTRLDPSVGAANLLASVAMTLGDQQGSFLGPLIIGNENRNLSGGGFLGRIDEVRISSVARATNQMQFYTFSPLVSITQNPVSQNVDYSQPVTFSVIASSPTALGYQWRFNSNSIADVTNSTYLIPNVAAGNAGYYDVVVTNTAGYAATSSPALLVAGAANFLNHRYSFTTDTSDSIGGATGTNFGAATVTGGALVLDGTTGTYMKLPGNLFNGTNATALTVEFWATFGVNAADVRVFDFGITNGINGTGLLGTNGIQYVGFTPHNGSLGHSLLISPDSTYFQQQVTWPGTLDGLTRHIACVIDPPNKTLAIYTNGVLEAVNTNLTVGIASLNDALSYIGRSLFAANPYLNASIDELRLYNGALAGVSIKQSDDQGPNALLAAGPANFVLQPADASVPVGQTVTFTVVAAGSLPISYQWFKNGTLVPGATSASYSFATVIGDNNATFLAYATNTIGVTTYVTNSSTATLTVFIPSTLAWLDAANGGADGDWNTTSLNWTNDAGGGGVIAFSQTNGVIFDSRGSGSPTVDLVQSITPYNITVDATTDYLLTSTANNGSLVGQGSIIKLNSGKLTIDVANNMTGATTISGGTLQVGNGDGFGTLGSGPVTNNTTLSFNRSDAALSVPSGIHGSGTVSFDGSGSVAVSGASDYTGSTLINSGVLNLQSSSGLGATSGGTTVANGGQLYITASVDVPEDLTLNGSGPDGSGALRKSGAGLTTCSGTVALASDSTIGVGAGFTLGLSNTVMGAAALNVTGGGILALDTTNNYSGGTTLSAAIILINTNGALGTGPVTVSGPGRFVIADGLNITNDFTANAASPTGGNGVLMVKDNTNGTVTTISGKIALNVSPDAGGDFNGPSSSGYLNVSGPVTAPDGTTVSIRLGNVRFSGGGSYTIINVLFNTTSIGADNGLATNAVMDIAGSGSTTVATYFDLNGFNQTLAGLKNQTTPAALPWVTNSSATLGTLTLNLGAASYTFGGSIVGNLSLALNSGSQTLAKGTAAADGRYIYTGNTLVNGGTLVLGSGIVLSNTPAINIAAGATLNASVSGLNLGPAQTLKGNGTVIGDVIGGGVSPGASIGVLTVNGNATLTGLTTIEVNKSLGTNDQLIVSGAVTYGGTLFATNLAGTLSVGDNFTVTSAASSSGNFSAVTGTAGFGKGWSFNPTNGVLSVVVATVNTSPTNLTATVSGSSLILSWPADYLGWRLQSQTNPPAIGLSTNWVDVTGSALVNSVTNVINPANGSVFYRMVYP